MKGILPKVAAAFILLGFCFRCTDEGPNEQADNLNGAGSLPADSLYHVNEQFPTPDSVLSGVDSVAIQAHDFSTGTCGRLNTNDPYLELIRQRLESAGIGVSERRYYLGFEADDLDSFEEIEEFPSILSLRYHTSTEVSPPERCAYVMYLTLDKFGFTQLKEGVIHRYRGTVWRSQLSEKGKAHTLNYTAVKAKMKGALNDLLDEFLMAYHKAN